MSFDKLGKTILKVRAMNEEKQRKLEEDDKQIQTKQIEKIVAIIEEKCVLQGIDTVEIPFKIHKTVLGKLRKEGCILTELTRHNPIHHSDDVYGYKLSIK